MALSAEVVWRVRTDGAEINGGGYDATVSGAGTNYTDQATAQLAITDLTSTASTTVFSAAAGFTAAMVGNVLRLASGAGTTPGYYMIVGYVSATQATLDRASGTYTVGIAKVGGAHASLTSYASSANALAAPVLATPLAAGHTIYIRGAGSNDPSAVDYDYKAGYFVFPSGSLAAGRIRLIGYNGRPRIDVSPLLGYTSAYWSLINIVFFQNAGVWPTYSVFSDANTNAINCRFDVNGNDSNIFCGSAVGCHFKNSGATTAGVYYAHISSAYDFKAIGNVYENCRGGAINCASGLETILNNIIRNCKGTTNMGSITCGGTYGAHIINNTIDAGAGDGIRITQASVSQGIILMNNIISNHAGSGKYGLNFTTGTTAVNDKLVGSRVDYNNLYGNTAARNSLSAGAHDIALDPQYANTGTGDYSVGTNMKAVGYPSLFPG